MSKKFYVILGVIILVIVAALIINSLAHKKGSVSEVAQDLSDPSLLALYDGAKELESEGAYLEAKALYVELLEKSQDEKLAEKAEEDLMALNMKILFSSIPTEDSVIYTVKKGDTLTRIAKKFNTTVELIMKSNNLESDVIRIGKRLKISTSKYSVVVDYSQNVLTLKSDEDVLKTYKVSTGINKSTPIGIFKIVNKLKDPVWYSAGAIVSSGSPENILGSRWMGISIVGYGIHGTTQPETIGQHITAGCVRMKEPDVQELYAILPVGTEVTIVE